jgi:hypothetical protein
MITVNFCHITPLIAHDHEVVGGEGPGGAPRGVAGRGEGQSPTARLAASVYWSYSWSLTRPEMSMISAE